MRMLAAIVLLFTVAYAGTPAVASTDCPGSNVDSFPRRCMCAGQGEAMSTGAQASA
jgi:hypothetical protein